MAVEIEYYLISKISDFHANMQISFKILSFFTVYVATPLPVDASYQYVFVVRTSFNVISNSLYVSEDNVS